MKKLLLTFAFCLTTLNVIFAQFNVLNASFQPTGVSNTGLVVGYEVQGGPYKIWNPDSSSILNIGGLAPGLGIGGQAHFSDSGTYISGTSFGILGAEMSRYTVATNQWSVVGSLGFDVDSTVSGGFGISGDGNTVVGLTWADTTGGLAYAHAAAWNQTNGFKDLGSLYDSIAKSSRANAASFDGSVVVGWQDFNGPWKSAVWRKDSLGNYSKNSYLLISAAGSATDEFNQLGECSTVSPNGVWIGGYGDYANNGEPWIWSNATGLINLGTMPNGSSGFVSGVNDSGTVAVGWFDGQFFGDPQIPFIWTATNGLQELNAYINSTLGLTTAPYVVYAANCLSTNGKYIAGYGIDTVNFVFFTYRLSTSAPLKIKEVSDAIDFSVYPNPFTHSATLDFATDEWHNVKVMDVLGKEIKSFTFTGKKGILVKGEIPSGIYVIQVSDKNKNQTNKKISIH
ncbi:MAG TPA: T9SS type A sorting domain-containing protein [Bacteroidia bacterium]|nr:T9SS type A sorting domain-containing protein [Bacteroidia bacterium]